jgi:hypothetical protein
MLTGHDKTWRAPPLIVKVVTAVGWDWAAASGLAGEEV